MTQDPTRPASQPGAHVGPSGADSTSPIDGRIPSPPRPRPPTPDERPQGAGSLAAADEEVARFRAELFAELKRASASPQALTVVRLMAVTGLRKSQVLALTRGQSDRANWLLHLHTKRARRARNR